MASPQLRVRTIFSTSAHSMAFVTDGLAGCGHVIRPSHERRKWWLNVHVTKRVAHLLGKLHMTSKVAERVIWIPAVALVLTSAWADTRCSNPFGKLGRKSEAHTDSALHQQMRASPQFHEDAHEQVDAINA